MKIFIVAAAAWAAGALLGYFVARLAYKHLRKRLRTLRQERKPPKKKMGTMDRILVLEAVFLVAYTVADLVVFWHTGSEPATLTGCVFGVCGLENGVIKGIIIAACFVAFYVAGRLNPDIVAIDIDGETVNVATAANLAMVTAYVLYAKDVFSKLSKLVVSKTSGTPEQTGGTTPPALEEPADAAEATAAE